MSRTPKPLTPLKRFDYATVQTRLEGFMINVDRDLQRRTRKEQLQHGPTSWNVHRLVGIGIMARLARTLYNALLFVGATEHDDPRRKPNYILIAPAVNRQLLDLLFTLIFVLDDYPERLLQYDRAGYREVAEQYQRYYLRFGKRPEWKDFFKGQRQLLANLEALLEITPEQKKRVPLISRWPTPGQLIDKKSKSRPFIRWLYKWFYQDTSEQAHLSNSGLLRAAPFMLAEIVGGEDQELIEQRIVKQYHYIEVSRAAVTALAIHTELSVFFKLGNNPQNAYLWQLFVESVEEAKDMFEERYQKLLSY